MNKETKKALKEALAESQVSGADADRSEQPANEFSNLNSDDGEGYNAKEDPTPEAEKERIHDQ